MDPRNWRPSASRVTTLSGKITTMERWRKWISEEDNQHIEAVAQSVQEGYLPASAALGSVNTGRLAAEAEYRATWLARLFQGIRNLGVLFPILITWISFALASSAYNASLAAVANQSQGNSQQGLFTLPLLQQWEQGFDVPSAQFGPWTIPLVVAGNRWFTFSHFALIDALLILGLIAITFVAQVVEAIGLSHARETMRGVEIRLFEIAENRSASALGGQTIEEKTQRSFEEIGRQLSRLEQAIGEFTFAMKDVPQSTLQAVTDRLTAFETGQVGRINESYQTAAAAQAATNDQVTRFVGGTNTLLNQMTAAVDKLREHWNTLGNLEREIGKSAQEAARAAAGAANTASSLPSEIHTLAVAQEGVRTSLESISSVYNASISHLQGIGSHFDQTAQMQQEMVAAQRSAQQQLAALQQSISQIDALLKRIEQLERALGADISLGGRRSKPGGFFGFFKR